MPDDKILASAVVRAWEPTMNQEGARFLATCTRRDVTFQARTGVESLDVETITRPGLIIIAPSAGPGRQNAVDVVVRAIPDQIKFTVLQTEELLWFPVAAHRDAMLNWHIETIQYVDWLKIMLRDEPHVMNRGEEPGGDQHRGD